MTDEPIYFHQPKVGILLTEVTTGVMLGLDILGEPSVRFDISTHQDAAEACAKGRDIVALLGGTIAGYNRLVAAEKYATYHCDADGNPKERVVD